MKVVEWEPAPRTPWSAAPIPGTQQKEDDDPKPAKKNLHPSPQAWGPEPGPRVGSSATYRYVGCKQRSPPTPEGNAEATVAAHPQGKMLTRVGNGGRLPSGQGKAAATAHRLPGLASGDASHP